MLFSADLCLGRGQGRAAKSFKSVEAASLHLHEPRRPPQSLERLLNIMSCCCFGEKSPDKHAGGVTDVPPKAHAMKRDEMADDDSDHRAVAWMRSRSENSGQTAIELSPSASKAWQNGRRSQVLTPTKKYRRMDMATLESIEVDELSQIKAERRHGNITPSTASSFDHSSSTSRPERDMHQRSNSQRTDTDVDELDAIVLALEQQRGSGSGSASRRSRQSDRSATPPPRRSLSASRNTSANDDLPPKHRRSPSAGGTPSPRASDRHSPVAPKPDVFVLSLSDIPNDVDPVVRERYLKAYRLLHATLIERETALLPSERSFLQRLIQEGETNPTDEQLSAVETASQTLMSDPLFQVDSVHSSLFDEPNHHNAENVKPSWIERARANDRDATSRISEKTTRIDNRHMPALMDDEAMTDTGGSHTDPNEASIPSYVARFDGKDFPFYILGVTPDFKVGVLTPALMESLRGFFPASVGEENFWLKFSVQRDGESLSTLLSRVRTSRHTVMGVETKDGHVFGVFCSSPWRTQSTWFGSGESFLWRLKRSRLLNGTDQRRIFDFDNEMEVYPYTGSDELIQYCTRKTLAVGGGVWTGQNKTPFPNEPTGIGFMVDGDLMGGETNSCATFGNPRLGNRLNESNEFDIRSLEVWTVTPAATMEAAEQLEMHRHFVEEKGQGR